MEIRKLYVLLLVMGMTGCGPTDEEAIAVIGAKYQSRGYDPVSIEITGREQCSSRSGDEARNITERWLIGFTEQYSNQWGYWMLYKQNSEWY